MTNIIEAGGKIRLSPDSTESQISTAESETLPHLGVLRDLDPDAMVYAMMGRGLALFNGESQATIDAIVSRATAGDYVTSTALWSAMSAAERSMFVSILEINAFILQLVIARL